MRRRNTTTGRPAKAQHHRPTKQKRNYAPKAVRRGHSSSLADLQEQVTFLTRELEETRQQQTATSEVLRVISSSLGDLEPVFQTMLINAMQVCEAKLGFMNRYDGDTWKIVAVHGAVPSYTTYLQQHGYRRPGPETVTARIASTKQIVQVADLPASRGYIERDPVVVAAVELGGVRTILGVPMLKEDGLIGAIILYRQEVRPFTDRQIELVKSFAAQAVIAIENVRLLTELRARTSDLAQSVNELRALGEVSQTVNSTLDLEAVLNAIVSKAAQLSGTEAGAIYAFEETTGEYQLRASFGMSDNLIEAIRDQHAEVSQAVERATAECHPVQAPDLRNEPTSVVRDIVLRAGYLARLVVPLLSAEGVIGALVVRRKAPGEFPRNTTELLQTFAAQSVLAIKNARLFSEIREKSRQLAEASQHKSQFLANMSHELRTPLNAILGYTELIIDGIYGNTPDKVQAALQRVESNGRHLLGLINDVLDFSKIEAGQLKLAPAEYSMKDVVYTVFSAVEPLAAKKNLNFKVDVPPDMPGGYGDERKLTQVLLNLVGNAIKFTDAGEIAIKVAWANDSFRVAVHDTGPGIALADQERLFQEFQQADNSITKTKGGTGLGLAISRRIIEMHGGRLWVESSPGNGSVFTFTVPTAVENAGRS